MAEQAVLPPQAASAGRARRFVANALTSAGARDAVDVATLLVSELVANAVLHAGGELGVRVTCEDARVRVEVADGSAAIPQQRQHANDASTGRGLLLVDALAADWGVRRNGGGKIVWFELARSEPGAR